MLAPMSGYTASPFRAICRRYHAGLVFTGLVSAEGVARLSPKTMHFLKTAPGERPVGAHIYGARADSFARAAEIIEGLGRFDLIDINCGCPVPKVTSKGAGVSLMRTPEKIYEIVRKVVGVVSLPVTVKIRLGVSPAECTVSETAQAVEEAGGAAVTVHARFGSQRHVGEPHWEFLGRVKRERSIPVIGNGGIDSAKAAFAMVEETKVDGVMIGRAALGNPWLFGGIHSYCRGNPASLPDGDEIMEVIETHVRGMRELMRGEYRGCRGNALDEERIACTKFRSQLVRYLSMLKGWGGAKKEILAIHSVDTLIDAVARFVRADLAGGKAL
jgi:nifR3 family TIM-barrel protein